MKQLQKQVHISQRYCSNESGRVFECICVCLDVVLLYCRTFESRSAVNAQVKVCRQSWHWWHHVNYDEHLSYI